MNNLFSRLALILIVALSGTSCTTLLFIKKTLPPEITLESAGNSMVIQNYFDYTRPEYVKEKHEEVFHAAVASFTRELVSSLEGENLVMAIQGDTLVRKIKGRIPSDMLNPDSVSSVCNRYNTNLMLSVDSVYIGFDWETETMEDDDGSRYRVKSFYLEVQPFLSLYNSQGILIDRSYVYRQVLYKDRLALSGLITIKPSLAKAIAEVTILAGESGHDYGAKFFGSYGTFEYKVFYSKPFDVSYSLMLNREWADAIRELLPLAESSEKKIAKRAANNLWVAYTGIGDETSAEMWYKKSLGK